MKPKILVADDDEMIAASIRRALIYEAYNVEVAYNGALALAAEWTLRARHGHLVATAREGRKPVFRSLRWAVGEVLTTQLR